ncbi:AbrB/MazE/SpoVT family DNA-binding domain-containing protein [Frankia sp. Cr2]|uniref:AbrB/MazE/SpoVT family DNA-binding domain-containing protein n=1 Tax=Frankia sp. Cr2 TaxID=3073932 RepID=UPI002AD5A746|nr:AbrB/MazE/SpoVT family DNA-binding domain-containing protein [Frankia sp. Cr2]
MEVKRRPGVTRVSRKHQVTLPVEVLRDAGLAPGDELRVTADGRGRLAGRCSLH